MIRRLKVRLCKLKNTILKEVKNAENESLDQTLSFLSVVSLSTFHFPVCTILVIIQKTTIYINH